MPFLPAYLSLTLKWCPYGQVTGMPIAVSTPRWSKTSDRAAAVERAPQALRPQAAEGCLLRCRALRLLRVKSRLGQFQAIGAADVGLMRPRESSRGRAPANAWCDRMSR